MSVVWCKEITGRDANRDVDSNKRYRRVFQVITDTPQDGAFVVLQCDQLPTYNDVYAYLDETDPLNPVPIVDTEAVVVSLQPRQDDADNLCNWTVIVEYAGVGDPVSQPAEVEYDPTPYQKAEVDDVNGVPVSNTAGDPFEGGMTVDRTRFTLVVVKNLLDFDPIAADAYQDTLNQTPFLVGVHATSPDGFPAGTCKLKIGARRIRRYGTIGFYWAVRYVIDIDRRGWKVKLRNAGFRAMDFDGVVREVKNTDGTRPSLPTLLDGGGARLLPGDAPLIAGPTLDGFDGYETKDWTPLGITY